MNIRKVFDRCTAMLLVLSMLLSLAACAGAGDEAVAATMHLKRTEGSVDVSDDSGEDVPLLENLGLYSGYGVDTRSDSYAWIDLDAVKLTKMDQDSEITITQEGKDLEIEVLSGSLFFNVTEPLAEDETMNIRTSTMLVGIRGTCGWVEVPDEGHMNLYLLEGRVKCTAGDNTETVLAGEMAAMTEDGGIAVSTFTEKDVPAFVLEDIEDDDDLAEAILDDSGLDVLDPPEPDPLADALEAYRAVAVQADTYFADDTDYGTMEVTITYKYALVRMQADASVPALILEQETFGDYWGDMCSAIAFQYDPDSQTVIQAEGTMGEGVASAGGYRGSLTAAGDKNGILETSWYSGSGEGETDRITIDGDSLSRTVIWSGNIYDDTSSGVASVDIDWHDISDLSGLDSWVEPEITLSEAPEQGEEPAGEEPLPADGDRIVFRGALGQYSDEELISLQGLSEAEAQSLRDGSTYWIIVLDEPQDMALSSVSDPGYYYTRNVSMIAVFETAGIEQYAGQNLAFSIDADSTWWPSDASLPLGQPRTDDIHVLE